MGLREDWDAEAEAWIAWARKPGHDSYWQYHRDQFLPLLPEPGRLTVDLGCGEGRLTRELYARGHHVIGLDGSPALGAAARTVEPSIAVCVSDAAKVPLGDASADLVVAFMSLHDFDDMPAAIGEAARVLEAGGRLCLAIVHPINSAGLFEEPAADARFVIDGDYLGTFAYADKIERDGLAMTFHSLHRPLEAYFFALEAAGFLVETLREPRVPDHAILADRHRRWQRLPLFLHLRARRM